MVQRVGTQLGNYRIIREIGAGAYGTVYLAKHRYVQRNVAIKFIQNYLNAPDLQEQFRQEAELLEQLKHPNILTLIEFGFDENCPYLIAPYAAGGSLRDRLVQQAPHLLPMEESLRILAQVGRALHYVHLHQVIHRDLKPDNILFNEAGQAQLADFGIATVLQTASTASMMLGTPSYMAPEQFKGKACRESDQYALGCVAYELFTGQRPFTAETALALAYLHVNEQPIPPRRLNPEIPPAIEQAMLTALEKVPADRHSDVEAFLSALGIRRPPKTRFDFSVGDEPTALGSMEASDATQIRRSGHPPSETDTSTEISPRRSFPPRQSRTAVPQVTAAIQQTPTRASPTRSSSPNTLPVVDALLATEVPSVGRQQRRIGLSTPQVTRSLFLAGGILDILLLLSGFFFGFHFFSEAGIVLAMGITICGIALNFFVEPWIWLVAFLLLSPASGGLYLALVNFFTPGHGVDGHLLFGYFMLSPIIGLLYGACGTLESQREPITPARMKTLTLTIWFLGLALALAGIGIFATLFVGLAWMLASSFLAMSQLIRLKQGEWIMGLVISLVFMGIGTFFWGFAYGVAGPTESKESFEPFS